MIQGFLYQGQIRSGGAQEISSIGGTHLVGSHLCTDSWRTCDGIFLDKKLDAPHGQAGSFVLTNGDQEKGMLVRRRLKQGAKAEIFLQCFLHLITEIHIVDLVFFTIDMKITIFEIYIFEVDPDQLGHTKPGTDQCQADRVVSGDGHIVPVGRLMVCQVRSAVHALEQAGLIVGIQGYDFAFLFLSAFYILDHIMEKTPMGDGIVPERIQRTQIVINEDSLFPRRWAGTTDILND